MENFRGLLDDIRIYNRALSTEEVKALYDHERTPPDKTVSNPTPTPTESSPTTAKTVAPLEKLISQDVRDAIDQPRRGKDPPTLWFMGGFAANIGHGQVATEIRELG